MSGVEYWFVQPEGQRGERIPSAGEYFILIHIIRYVDTVCLTKLLKTTLLIKKTNTMLNQKGEQINNYNDVPV